MRRLLKYAAVVIALVVVAFAGVVIASFSRLDDAYAQWGAADMLIDYMGDHDGDWPKQWADLRPHYDAGGGRVAGWDFDRYTDHGWIGKFVPPTKDRGRPRSDRRRNIDAIRHRNRTGCQWRYIPRCFGPRQTI